MIYYDREEINHHMHLRWIENQIEHIALMIDFNPKSTMSSICIAHIWDSMQKTRQKASANEWKKEKLK